MAYATLADLMTRFGEREIVQLTDTEQTGAPDSVTVGRALGDADAEIDAALVGRYQLPMAPVPELLRRIACDLARESLYTDTVPDVVKNRGTTARRLLTSVANGTLRFEDAAPASVSAAKSDARIEKGRSRMRWPGGRGDQC